MNVKLLIKTTVATEGLEPEDTERMNADYERSD